MAKNYKWVFDTWRLRQEFIIGIEWCAEKSWFRGLTEFDVYLGWFAFGWLKNMPIIPEEKKTKKAKK